MKLTLRVLLILIILVFITTVAGVTYLKTAFPKVSPAPELKVELTPENIERGKYLANNVAVCIDCHSTRDWNYLTGPIIEGTEGKGGEYFPREFGFPGNFYSKNITPAALGNWTDGEIYRAIVSGVSKDGNAMFPVMPYHSYGKLDKSDILAVVAYLRTLKPIENEIKLSEADFPFSLILNTIPKDPEHQSRPDTSDVLNYGKYLFTAAACNECHTKEDKGEDLPGMESAGGFEFPLPGGIVRSANITPDHKTGIGSWTKEMFIGKFKYYSSPEAKKIKSTGYNTIMPWTMYAGMSESDLGAIYTYLQSIKPVENEIIKFTPE